MRERRLASGYKRQLQHFLVSVTLQVLVTAQNHPSGMEAVAGAGDFRLAIGTFCLVSGPYVFDETPETQTKRQKRTWLT